MIKPPSPPPRLALRLLALMTERDQESGAAGDLEERYTYLAQDLGTGSARRDCWRQVLAAGPGFIRNLFYWSHQMHRYYLKIALRLLRRHKGYAAINIAGLAVGIACALFILLWVQDELSFDRFHANANSLYRVEQDQKSGQGRFHVTVNPYPMGPALKAEIPEVKDVARFDWPGTFVFRYGENAFYERRTAAVDPSFLKMFTFPLVSGNAETALSRPGSIVITENLAKKYFGAADPMGKAVTINNRFSFLVTGIAKNVPFNSSLKFDLLVPFDFIKDLGQYDDSWRANNVETFVQIHEKSDLLAVAEKVKQVALAHVLKEVGAKPQLPQGADSYDGPLFTMMPLSDIYLYQFFGFARNDQAVNHVNTFAAIALLVLLIACINFMNLATARSASRAKEVGLRKVVGAFRKSIAAQFYGESIVTAFLSAGAALSLVVALLPMFNRLSGKQITRSALLSGNFLISILAVAAITGIVAGSYPAMALSAFRPIRVLRGGVSSGVRGALFRKILVVVQFGFSILLLIGMGVVSRQVNYMMGKKLGYEKDHLVYISLRGDTPRSYPVFKEEALRDPRLQGVTSAHQPPTSIGSNGTGADWDKKDPKLEVLIGFGFVDFDFTETMKVEMAAGRTFSTKIPSDKENAFLVNEEVPKLMGLDAASAVGKRFKFVGVNGTIIGVMKNFHYQSVRNAIEPLAIICSPDRARFAIARLKAGEIPASLDALKAAWQKINPQYPFEYKFFDQDFEQMYQADERMGTVLKVFGGLAIFIACLGLFGLASFTAEQRTKEIGVRKVLGASAPGIVALLSKEFAKWVLAANLFAWPVAYLVMKNWLRGFAYRSSLDGWLFVAAGAGALAVALLTVSYQAVRAALSNPADAIKYE
jgi:putative ABC transport system permease protein